MEYILIAKILNTHGIKGELKCETYTDFIDERFKKGSNIYIGDNYLSFKVKSYRYHKDKLLLTLQDNEDINLVEKYKGENIYKSINDIKPLDDGEYYFRDIKDLKVFVSNKEIGYVKNMEDGSTCNYMRIVKDDKEYLVPFLDNFIENIDLDKKRIDIIEMEGLL